MSLRTIVLGLVAAGGFTLVAGSAQAASQPKLHDGFYLRLSPNLGLLSTSATVEGLSGEAKYSGFATGGDLLIGGTVTRGLVIGGGLVLGNAKDPKVELGQFSGTADGSLLFAGAAVFANYYFDPAEGLYLQGMLGGAAIQLVNPDGGGGNSPSGMMLGFGGGYEFWVGDEWSIGPTARVIYAPLSYSEGGATAKYGTLYLTLGAGFTFH